MGIAVAVLIRILTASIAPVIVISGVGLLLLSMTNRYGRAIDRARDLTKDLDASGDDARRHLLVEQVQIIYTRALYLRKAIILGAASIFFVSVMVLSLFTGQVLATKRDYVSAPCFGLCLLCLLGSLYYFLHDVSSSLRALELEIFPYVGNPGRR